jgi:hypothetical protein
MASKIDLTLAKSLIQEFRKENASANGPSLKTIEGHNLHGYFIDRESLDEILKDPKVTGISLSHAKHPDAAGKPDNAYTLVYSGVAPATEPGAQTAIVSRDVYGPTPTCPPVCPPPST